MQREYEEVRSEVYEDLRLVEIGSGNIERERAEESDRKFLHFHFNLASFPGLHVDDEGEENLETGCDADGDLAPRRRKRRRERLRCRSVCASGLLVREEENSDLHHVGEEGANVFSVTIEVWTKSSALMCGMQLWGAAILLTDYLISHMPRFRNHVVVELGAGVGLPGLISSQMCRRVFLTDFDDDILSNCLDNVKRNALDPTCCVRRLDWNDTLIRARMQAEIDIHQASANNFGRDSHSGESGESTGERDDGGAGERDDGRAGGKGDKFRWRDADFLDLMECSIFLAADVIYSNELTDSFLTQVNHILHSWPPPRKNGKGLGVDRQVYVAIERRCNFTLPECATTSREYDYFMSLVSAGGGCHALGGGGAEANTGYGATR